MMEIRNPAKLPTDLNPAEKHFARCLAAGEFCKIGNGKLPEPEERIESGDNANMVRSEVIRFFAYGGNEKDPVSGEIILLHGAWISGALDLTHANIPYVLRFENCHFAIPVGMQHAECAALYLNGSRLAQGLLADGLTTKGSVNLRDNFFAEGEVRLLGANIGGNLDCTDGKFHHLGKYALVADGLATKGSVNLLDGFFAEGEVRLLGANIGGNLNCIGGKFHNLGGNALNVDGMTTKGSVNLRSKFSAEGEVRLLGANIGGNLDCENGKFHNSGRKALSADGLTTKGDVFLRNSFSAKGEVRLLGANIGGNLDCTGGKFHNPDENKYALDVYGGNINSGLFWRKTTCEGNVNLASAKADVLADDSDSWKSCKVVLDGFTYNRFANPMDAWFRIGWLAKRPDGRRFSPLPYEQAAKVLRTAGKDIEAWDIEWEKNRQQREADKASLIQEFGGWLLDTLKDAGYRPWRIVRWGLFVMALGVAVFAGADYHSNIVPTHPVVALSDDYKRKIAPNCGMRPTQAVPPEYPAFNPLVFSLDVFTPSAVFHQEDSWGPRSGGGDWLDFDFDILWLLTLWYWLEVAMGWILTSMLLLSVTGLLRPRQSSGERD